MTTRPDDPQLFIFGGLPGAGKSTLARHLAGALNAVYLRIDTIEQALHDQGVAVSGPEGYVVAYRLAEDNLRLGRRVVADSVNPIEITRAAWRAVAHTAGAPFCEIEVVCSDPVAHRRRVETRPSQVPNLRLPTWQDVLERAYEPWHGRILRIDTAGRTPAESQRQLLQILSTFLATDFTDFTDWDRSNS